MIDRDLAELYQVETKVLNQAVKRNKERFPQSFIFQLSNDEILDWKAQIVTSNGDKMGLRRPPYACSEHGVAVLSAVLRSSTAIQVSIQIMHVFVAFIAEREVIKRILRHLGLWEEGVRLNPSGAPSDGEGIVKRFPDDPFPDYSIEPVMNYAICANA
jgi:hypothetical protein